MVVQRRGSCESTASTSSDGASGGGLGQDHDQPRSAWRRPETGKQHQDGAAGQSEEENQHRALAHRLHHGSSASQHASGSHAALLSMELDEGSLEPRKRFRGGDAALRRDPQDDCDEKSSRASTRDKTQSCEGSREQTEAQCRRKGSHDGQQRPGMPSEASASPVFEETSLEGEGSRRHGSAIARRRASQRIPPDFRRATAETTTTVPPARSADAADIQDDSDNTLLNASSSSSGSDIEAGEGINTTKGEGLRRRRAEHRLAREDLPKMAASYGEEETASFLPGGASQSRKVPLTKRLRSCGSGLIRRRRALILVGLLVIIISQTYLFGPRLVGEERMSMLEQKMGETLEPVWKGMGLPPPPPSPENAPPPPSAGYVGTSAGGNTIYLPLTELPPDYERPAPPSEDALRIGPNAFPPEWAKTLFATKPATPTLPPAQQDADPHHGQIPTAQRSRLLRAATTRERPPRPQPAGTYPDTFYIPMQGQWRAEVNGSRTTYLDAMQPVGDEPIEDWREPPYNTWRPPTLLREDTRLPRVQYDFNAPDRHSGMANQPARDAELEERQKLVKGAFMYAWEAYKARAWGHDEIRPVSGVPHDSFNGWGATIVDALDTLLVMGMPEEYDLARQHVRDIDFRLVGGSRSAYGSSDGRIPVFETAIRYLGGFLAAYDLSGDTLMRDRAEELAQMILPAFDTPTGVPFGRLNFADPPGQHYVSGGVVLAEAASMLLEMTRLWQVTGNRTYFDRVQRTTDWLDRNMTGSPDRLGALMPTTIFPERGTMYGWYSWGGMVDSAYEYLIKEHQLLGGRLEQYGRMFGDVVDSAAKWLIRDVHTVPNAPLLVLGHSNGKSFAAKLEHLTCFAGGTMGLGARLLSQRKRDLARAERVTEACWWAYNATTTGIGPEELTFYKDKDIDRYETVQTAVGASRRGKARGAPIVGVRNLHPDYRNRPETIESVFYMWRITGDQKWQERGWQMFCSWVTHGMSNYGFSSIFDVMHVPVQHTDSMESFVFAETFKYYFLLFSPPSLISLDDYVFTTEAHPLLAPKNGRWAQAGKGARQFWDPAAPHVPASQDEYSGGEMGNIGGLTNVQKTFLAQKHGGEVAAKEAEAKAKEKSLLNSVKLNGEHLRQMLTKTIPVGTRLSVDDLKKAAADAMSHAVPTLDAQAKAAPVLAAALADGKDNAVLRRALDENVEVVFVDEPSSEGQDFAECGHEDHEHEHIAYDADGPYDEEEEGDLHGQCWT